MSYENWKRVIQLNVVPIKGQDHITWGIRLHPQALMTCVDDIPSPPLFVEDKACVVHEENIDFLVVVVTLKVPLLLHYVFPFTIANQRPSAAEPQLHVWTPLGGGVLTSGFWEQDMPRGFLANLPYDSRADAKAQCGLPVFNDDNECVGVIARVIPKHDYFQAEMLYFQVNWPPFFPA